MTMTAEDKVGQHGVPDLAFAKARISIIEVADALNLERHGRQIRCWRPENHQHGDRTPSVGIQLIRNRAKCFVCDARSLSSVDLVQSVLKLDTYGALSWLDKRFEIPRVKRGSHIARRSQGVTNVRVGVTGNRLETIVRAGMFGAMGIAECCLLVVLDALTDQETGLVTISYAGLQRFSGLRNKSTISRAVNRLADFHALEVIRGRGGNGLAAVNQYRLTLEDTRFISLLNECAAEQRDEIAAERRFRADLRSRRVSTRPAGQKRGTVVTGINLSLSGRLDREFPVSQRDREVEQ